MSIISKIPPVLFNCCIVQLTAAEASLSPSAVRRKLKLMLLNRVSTVPQPLTVGSSLILHVHLRFTQIPNLRANEAFSIPFA